MLKSSGLHDFALNVRSLGGSAGTGQTGSRRMPPAKCSSSMLGAAHIKTQCVAFNMPAAERDFLMENPPDLAAAQSTSFLSQLRVVIDV